METEKFPMEKQPQLLVIGGCNGAGKTTAARGFLGTHPSMRQFVNADEIARGLSPFEPESVALQAGKTMLRRIKDLAERRSDFAIESTLSGKTYVTLLSDLITSGYRVSLFYAWLRSPNLAVERVAARVKVGGHDIPTDVIHRRYSLSARNLFDLYMPLADEWFICDNSDTMPALIAQGGRQLPTKVHHGETYIRIQLSARQGF